MGGSTTEHQPLLALQSSTYSDDGDVEYAHTRKQRPLSVWIELHDLFTLVFPVMITTALEFAPGITSLILTGHLESPDTKEYVDGATLATMFLNITGYSIGFGLSSALDTLCSQAYGAKRPLQIGIYVQTGFLVIGSCLPMIIFVNYYSEMVLLVLGQDATVAAYAQLYSRYNLIGVPFVFTYEIVRKVMQAQGIMTPLVVIAAIGNIIQIVSGYVLAYHTPLGFTGIALSRSLGNVSLPIQLYLYLRWVHPHHLTQWWNGWDFQAANAHINLFLSLGIPGMLMLIMEWWAFEMLSLMAGVLPNSIVAMSAHAVLLNVVSMLFMLFLGFSVAANIRVGIHLGANRPRHAQMVFHIALCIALFVSISLATGVFVGHALLPALFVADPESIRKASQVLMVWAPFEVADGLNCVVQGVYRGAGRQDHAAKFNAVAYYLVGMPIAYVLGFQFHWGIEGLWTGLGIGAVSSCGALLIGISQWRWKELAQDAQERTAT